MTEQHQASMRESANDQPKRGRLKVFLSYSPGVGKTFRLLTEARAHKNDGADVVLGYVETRDRAETVAQTSGLEAIARRKAEYRGVTAEEMDLDAVLVRRPQVVFIDDIAHTNVPDSRHRRRYEDVLELLEAGISVVCAFDVQHLESLNHLVERMTGIPIRESIPDSFLRQADEVVMVDISVEDLLERRRMGKLDQVENGEPVPASARFNPDHLTALRGLALREVSESLEQPVLTRPRGAKKVGSLSNPNRVLVCLASASPRAQVLLYKGSRMAGRLNTHWFVVYVETPGENTGKMSAEAQQTLQDTLESARAIGAEVVRLQAADPVQGILEFASSHSVRDIIIGRSHQPWWKQVLGLSPIHRLLAQASGFDVHVISFDEDERI